MDFSLLVQIFRHPWGPVNSGVKQILVIYITVYGISYLIKSFSSDKNELVPFSLHSEAADRDRPRPLEAAGRAKNRLFSLVEEAEWVVTGDADLKIPK